MKKSVIVFIMAFVLFIGLTHSVVTIEAASPVDTMASVGYPQQNNLIINVISIIIGIAITFFLLCFGSCILNSAKHRKYQREIENIETDLRMQEYEVEYNTKNANYKKEKTKNIEHPYTNSLTDSFSNNTFSNSVDNDVDTMPDYTKAPSFFD